MLDTSKERVELLKAGVMGKEIEKLYIMHNDLKIVHSPVVFELVEINNAENKSSRSSVICQMAIECTVV